MATWRVRLGSEEIAEQGAPAPFGVGHVAAAHAQAAVFEPHLANVSTGKRQPKDAAAIEHVAGLSSRRDGTWRNN